jgi:hypothetical protein
MIRFFTALLFICLSTQMWGLGIGLTEQQARKESDIIAHVRIVATTPAPDLFDNKSSPSDLKTDSFSQLATAQVLTAAKGCKEGDVLTLAFNNGYGCPNIHYTEKEECLVFLKKSPDGPYHTLNLYCGRFTVEKGQVQGFYLMHAPGQAPESVPLNTVLTWLKQPASK